MDERYIARALDAVAGAAGVLGFAGIVAGELGYALAGAGACLAALLLRCGLDE